jgi:hypothetical protein
MDMQKFAQQLTGTDNTATRRSVFGLLAGALAVTGFAGLQSADARRRGNGGNGGNGGRGHGRGRRRGGRNHNRNHRH